MVMTHEGSYILLLYIFFSSLEFDLSCVWDCLFLLTMLIISPFGWLRNSGWYQVCLTMLIFTYSYSCRPQTFDQSDWYHCRRKWTRNGELFQLISEYWTCTTNNRGSKNTDLQHVTNNMLCLHLLTTMYLIIFLSFCFFA